jgi:ElaB/YqjD/DUF883 family membrane-anchored ribosome-binding protein
METRISNSTETAESPTATTERLVAELKTLVQRAQETAIDRAKAADRLIRDHPYQTLGVFFGLGVLIGVLARRR